MTQFWRLIILVNDAVVEHGLKLLSCVLFKDVLCSFRKDVRSEIIARCFVCPQYRRFMAEMDAEDERVMNEIDDIREHPERHPDWYPSGVPR